MGVAIQTEHLTKIYAGRVIAVNDMSFSVPTGAVYGLLGPNGAGKTTTLRVLLGLQRPSAGFAQVFGHSCGPGATNVRAMIGYLPTHPVLPGHLCPIEYLELLGKLCRIPSQIRKPRLTSLLRAVGLLSATDRRIQTFSTGMRTRLGIAASLLADPPLLIWDEPTAGLDPAARRFTLDLIRDLAKSRTIMIATHILSDIDQVCDHVGVMHEGRMIFSGSMREMKQLLQRDDFCIELSGDSEDIRQLTLKTAEVGGIMVSQQQPNTLLVKVAVGYSRAKAIANVLQLIEESNVTLQAIQSMQNETEYAYLQLLQQDSDHGFRRFDLQAPHKDNAATSDHGV